MSSPTYVTQNEYPLDDDTTLMSTTDVHSYITHANDTFVQVSGYQLDELTLFQGDVFDLYPELLADVGAVFDRAALIALPPPMRARYAAHRRAILPRPVDRLLITLDYDQSRMSGPPFSVQPPEIAHLFGVDHHLELLAEIDALSESPSWRQRGLTALTERVHWLRPRA